MPSQTFHSKRHDTAMSPTATFVPPDGLGFDLMTPAGSTATFIMRLPGSADVKFDKPAVVTGPWSVRYDPEPEDVDEIGAYDVEVEIVFPNNKKLTLPTVGYLHWVIEPDLDNE